MQNITVDIWGHEKCDNNIYICSVYRHKPVFTALRLCQLVPFSGAESAAASCPCPRRALQTGNAGHSPAG